jgi:CRP-like cAMP-binding protein
VSTNQLQRSADAIAGLDLFAGLPAAALEEVITPALVRTLARSARLFDQGEPVERAHVLLSGAIRISQTGSDGGEVVIRFIGPGDIFGSVAIFTDHCYPADGIAMVESTEVSWANTDLLGLIARYPQIAINLVTIVGRRLGELQNRVREMATQPVERRIANTVLRLARQGGRTSSIGTTIEFPLRRKDIADISGTTLHTVSRTLTEWRRREWIEDDKHRLILRSRDTIEQIAEGSSPALKAD